MQQELIEMLEEIIQYVEVWKSQDQEVIDKAEALIEKAKNNAPAVPQGEPVAWLDLSKMSASAMVYATGWKSNDKQSPLYTAAAIAPAQEVSDKHEREMLEVIDERDRVHEWADQLADAIAKHTGYEIGEHTSENNPWRMALNALVCHEANPAQEVGLTDEERADMACAVAAICTGTSSRTVAATAIEWTERALRAKGQ